MELVLKQFSYKCLQGNDLERLPIRQPSVDSWEKSPEKGIGHCLQGERGICQSEVLSLLGAGVSLSRGASRC